MNFKEGEKLIIVRFGELWLRGRNRGVYIKILRKNLLRMLDGENFELAPEYDRLLIKLSKKSDADSIIMRLSHLFGISNYEVAYATKPNLVSVNKLAKKFLAKLPKKSVVKIDAHRTYKGFKFNSIDAITKVRKTAKTMKLDVSNHDYAAMLFMNFTKEIAFVSMGKTKALRGLPVGSSGRGIILISGGIDSPVASWYAMKRGIEPIYLHIHALQSNKDVMKSKMHRLLEMLADYSPPSRVYCIPSHVFQLSTVKSGRYELILLKAFMLRLAERIAEKENAKVIFTGESLGQVASQTAENLGAESQGIKLPILRPLIGFDKEEIIKIARELGTYDESVKEYRDVCSINSKNPATQTTLERMRQLVEEYDIDKIVEKSLASAELFVVERK